MAGVAWAITEPPSLMTVFMCRTASVSRGLRINQRKWVTTHDRGRIGVTGGVDSEPLASLRSVERLWPGAALGGVIMAP